MRRAGYLSKTASNHAQCSAVIRQGDHRDIRLSDALVARRRHFVFSGQVDPQLHHFQFTAFLRKRAGVELLVQNACACRHPLHIAWANNAASASGITVLHFA